MRVERPTGPPPSARWRAHAPRQPGRRAPNPRSANLRISPRRARQTTWRTARSPAPRFLRPFLQIPNAPPCSREGVHVAPRPRSAPSPPPGLPTSSTPPAPRPDLRGTENTPPTRAARAETVKRRKVFEVHLRPCSLFITRPFWTPMETPEYRRVHSSQCTDGVSLCCLGWSAVARSQLTAISASWVEAILLPQPPE
ncbi:serine/arginine repetitive matrix protein 1-like [Pan troglodytes]|uniref:serine/arginine repetitive matrix protein 1-like n=1 Tax=Pan troglodytes TaxID=9598 RepID=UPI0023F223B9|nr:serine/arginine repetitive matrix protein 1-like [Pan troglodytes]